MYAVVWPYSGILCRNDNEWLHPHLWNVWWDALPAQTPMVRELHKTYTKEKIRETLYILDFHLFPNGRF